MKVNRKSAPRDIEDDFLMAHRYLYYCLGKPVLTDKAYDDLENTHKTRNRAGFARNSVGSDKFDDYPPHVRALGMYLLLKFGKRAKNFNVKDSPKKQHGTEKTKIVKKVVAGRRLVRKGAKK